MSVVFRWDGLFRWLRAKLLRSEVVVTGHCRMCGECCRDIMILDGGTWVSSERAFRKLVDRKPEYARFFVTCTDDRGPLCFTCRYLSDEGICLDHDNRPEICRRYPSPRIYYRGCDLRADCGYSFRALTFRRAWWQFRGKTSPPFGEVLKGKLDLQHKDDTGS
ncbi:YkgJ family cysteine cluster protein [Salidesulfovibrio onnuriiensis]|uniref:YkgJ family cysteine cluster protein n=1 Tax=Salidesulfovibrio onnuriiensis TaxID=2583823 RepID=UPI0011C798DA|nr:YkgJ family cysteine cluster protein [Salidesulfovibrio onnuriiensis]